MKHILSYLFCIMALMAGAQKNGNTPNATDYKGLCVLTTPKVTLPAAGGDDVKKFLLGYINNLKTDKTGLVLKHTTQSPGAMHYSFMQTYNGVEVYQSEVKANVDRSNVVRTVLDNSFDTRHWIVDVSAAKSNSVIAVIPGTQQAVLAEVIMHGRYEQLQYNNEVIYSRDIASYLQDSTVTGRIFSPDPLTTAQQVYTPTGVYKDADDTNAPWLDNQLHTVSFKADYTGGVFRLQNQYVILSDFDLPNIPVVTATTPVFNYNRSQSGFEDVNVYYHLNNYRAHVDGLGFNMANHLINVDPHAVDSQDQSYFLPDAIAPKLFFGQGGVDDGEDADVIVHEYGHFLSYNAAPGSNNGGQERASLDEAFGDYLAYSYSLAMGGTFNSGDIFNWDGHNQYWNGRTLNNSRIYPDSNTVGTMYYRSGIWSAALAGIHSEIGGPATDSLIYAAHYSYAQNLSMPAAGNLLIEADTMLTGGKYYCPIYKYLLQRGLAPLQANPCGFTGINDNEQDLPLMFMQHAASFTLVNKGNEALSFELLNITGQQVQGNRVVSDEIYKYENDWLPAGMYLVAVHYGNSTKVFKWVK